MKKKILIGLGFVGTAVLTAIIIFGFSYLKNYQTNLRLEGANMAVQTILSTVEKEGSVTFSGQDPKTGEKKSVKLVLEKPAAENSPAKK